MRFTVAVIALLPAILLSGCDRYGDAKKAVKAALIDPESAQFDDVTAGKEAGIVCGLVNAKNRMGGYIGRMPFYTRNGVVYMTASGPTRSDLRLLNATSVTDEKLEWEKRWMEIQVGCDFIGSIGRYCPDRYKARLEMEPGLCEAWNKPNGGLQAALEAVGEKD